MNNQLSLTTAWTCECGRVNSIANRFCPKCGRGLPLSVSKAIYEEEILLHKGIVLSASASLQQNRLMSLKNILLKGKRILIPVFLAVAIVLLHELILIVAVLSGIISMLFLWAHIYESARGIQLLDYLILKKYMNIYYVFSLIMFAVLWLTSSGIEAVILTAYKIMLFGWIITFIAAIILSAVLRDINVINRKAMRTAALPCIAKIICLSVILWLIY